MADPVQLTDLEVITRYSLAVRTAAVERAELLEALRADLAWLQRGAGRAAAPAEPDASAPAPDDAVQATVAATKAAPSKAAATKAPPVKGTAAKRGTAGRQSGSPPGGRPRRA